MADPSDSKANSPEREEDPRGSSHASQAAPVSFSDLVMSIAANAVAHLGGEDEAVPELVPSRADLQLAAHHVDMLAMLQEKTRGNLEPEEQNILGTLLYELRMKYLEAAQRAG